MPYLAGHSKKTCLETFKNHHHLLEAIGKQPLLTLQMKQDAEEFVCKIYGAGAVRKTNQVPETMFVKGVIPEKNSHPQVTLYSTTLSALTTKLWYGARLIFSTLS